MGLDGAELLMELEATFGVELDETDVARLRTPRDVVDVLVRKLAPDRGAADQRSQAMVLLRCALGELVDVGEERIAPQALLCDLLPTDDCRVWWPRLCDRLRARSCPALRRPRWFALAIGAAFAGTVVGVVLALRNVWGPEGDGLGIVLGLVAGIGVACFCVRRTQNSCRRLPSAIRTVQDLVPLALTSERVQWSQEAIADEVKNVVMHCLGVPEAKYREDARFVDDFGMD